MESHTVIIFLTQESEGTLDSEDDWESCMSSVEEDECFYDAVILDDSQSVLFLFSHQVTELGFRDKSEWAGNGL